MQAIKNVGVALAGALIVGASAQNFTKEPEVRRSISEDQLTQHLEVPETFLEENGITMEFVMTRGVEMPEVPNLEGREARRERRSAERKTKGKRKYGYK